MKIDMPAGAAYIIEELNKHGFEAYIVGGCVRDSLLGREPDDWDITTQASPGQVKRIFQKTVDTGIQHGTVTVLVDRKCREKLQSAGEMRTAAELSAAESHTTSEPYAYEVTTYRVDGVYEDHRRPSGVTFTASLEEDLKRRDFTINALAYNDERGVIDSFGGIEDLKQGVIRCVGTPADRFDEDALRILRAVRFSAQLGFRIDDDTRAAMREQAEHLRDISAERIQTELTKLIVSDYPSRLIDAYALGLTRVFLPEFDAMMETEQNNPYHLYTVGLHTVRVMEHVPKDVVLRYTALLHDVGKPVCKTTGEDGTDHFYGHQAKSEEMARIILRRLKMDNITVSRVCNLVLYHDYGITGAEDDNPAGSSRAFRRFLTKLGADNFSDFIAIRKADMAGQSDYNQARRQQTVRNMEDMYRLVTEEKHCLRISDLAIGGKDLIVLGMKPGAELGRVLRELLELVLDTPELNTKEQLTALAARMIEKHA